MNGLSGASAIGSPGESEELPSYGHRPPYLPRIERFVRALTPRNSKASEAFFGTCGPGHVLCDLSELLPADPAGERDQVRAEHVLRQVAECFAQRGVRIGERAVRGREVALLLVDLRHQRDRGTIARQLQ